MKLISCSNCGVVLDREKLIFLPMFDEHDEVIPGRSYSYIGYRMPLHECPVCSEKIKIED